MTSFSVWWESVLNSLGLLRDFSAGSEVLPKPSYTQLFPSVSPRQGDLLFHPSEGWRVLYLVCNLWQNSTHSHSRYKTKHHNYTDPLQMQNLRILFFHLQEEPHFSIEESSHWGESSHFSLRRVQAKFYSASVWWSGQDSLWAQLTRTNRVLKAVEVCLQCCYRTWI